MAVASVVLGLALAALPALADQQLHALGLRMARPSPAMVADDSLPGGEVAKSKKPIVDAYSLAAFMPDAMDQGQYGSCASCATGYAWKSYMEHVRKGAEGYDFSNTFSPSYLYPQVDGGGDYGSYLEDNLAVLCMRGITTMADQPYNTADSDSILREWPSQGYCDLAIPHRIAYASAKKVSFGKTLPATSPDELAKIKALILKGTPVLVGILVDNAFDSLPSGATNFVWYPNGLAVRGGHAFPLIGFNDTITDGAGHVGAFEFQNSWGADWCLAGRAFIAYDTFYGTNMVDGQVYYGVERKQPYTPKMKAQATIAHPYRGDIFVQIGVGPVTKPKWTEWFYYPLLINTLAGIWDEQNPNIVTTMDVSGGANYWPPTTKNDWWMRVVDSYGDGKTGGIIEFRVQGRTGGWVQAPGPVATVDMGDTYIHLLSSTGAPRLLCPTCDEAEE